MDMVHGLQFLDEGKAQRFAKVWQRAFGGVVVTLAAVSLKKAHNFPRGRLWGGGCGVTCGLSCNRTTCY